MKRLPEIIIVGSGGHARVLIGVLRSMKRFRIKGLLKEKSAHSSEPILGLPVLGTWDGLDSLIKKGIRNAALAVGDNAHREELAHHLMTLGFQLPPLVHAQARVEPSAIIESGAVICLGAIVGAGAVIQKGALVNTGSIIDHEVVLHPFVHVAPGCAIAGRVTVGTGTFIGIGSRVIDHLAIGRWSVVGAGSVVLRNVPDRVTVHGIPARLQKKSS